MSLAERHWWLRVVEALLVSAALVAVVAWYAVYGLPVDLHGAPYPVEDGLLVGGMVLMLGGTAARLLAGARRTRKRDITRRRAIEGYQDALSLAQANFMVRDVAQSEGAYFDITRRRVWLGVLICSLFIAGLVWAFVAGSGEWVHPIVVAMRHTVLAGSGRTTRFYPTAALLAGYVLVGFALGWFWFEMLLLDLVLGAASRLTVDSEGMALYPVLGRARSIRWHEARLLEVVDASRAGPTRQTDGRVLSADERPFSLADYALYDSHTRIAWGQPLFGDKDIMRIAPLVMARTGLRPRTLDARFVEPGRDAYAAPLRRRDSPAGLVLGVAVVGILLVALGLLSPKYLPQLVGGTALFVGVYAWEKVSAQRKAARQRSATPDVGVPQEQIDFRRALASGAVFEMTVGSAIMYRLAQVECVLAGGGIALGCAIVLMLQIAQRVMHVPGVNLAPLPDGWWLLFLGLIVAGVATVVVAVRARDTVVIADARGVRKRWMLGDTLIPWERVEHIRSQTVFGRPGYRVTDNGGRSHISWPVYGFHSSRKPQERGATLLTPDEMAELVAAQSGKTIE